MNNSVCADQNIDAYIQSNPHIIAVSHQNRIKKWIKEYCTCSDIDTVRFMNGAVIKIEFIGGVANMSLLYAGDSSSLHESKPYYQTDKFIETNQPSLNYTATPFICSLNTPNKYQIENGIIYLVRHGEALHNLSLKKAVWKGRLIKGRISDTLLTEIGCKQMDGAAQSIFDDLNVRDFCGFYVNRYASSDLNRARETMYRIHTKLYEIYASTNPGLLNNPLEPSNKFPTEMVIIPCLHEIVKNWGRENSLKMGWSGSTPVEQDTTSRNNCKAKLNETDKNLPPLSDDAKSYHTFYAAVGTNKQRDQRIETWFEIEQMCNNVDILDYIINPSNIKTYGIYNFNSRDNSSQEIILPPDEKRWFPKTKKRFSNIGKWFSKKLPSFRTSKKIIPSDYRQVSEVPEDLNNPDTLDVPGYGNNSQYNEPFTRSDTVVVGGKLRKTHNKTRKLKAISTRKYKTK